MAKGYGTPAGASDTGKGGKLPVTKAGGNTSYTASTNIDANTMPRRDSYGEGSGPKNSQGK